MSLMLDIPALKRAVEGKRDLEGIEIPAGNLRSLIALAEVWHEQRRKLPARQAMPLPVLQEERPDDLRELLASLEQTNEEHRNAVAALASCFGKEGSLSEVVAFAVAAMKTEREWVRSLGRDNRTLLAQLDELKEKPKAKLQEERDEAKSELAMFRERVLDVVRAQLLGEAFNEHQDAAYAGGRTPSVEERCALEREREESEREMSKALRLLIQI